MTGTKPLPVYWKTIRESPDVGTGLKNPVSQLLTASISCVAKSYRNTLETPV